MNETINLCYITDAKYFIPTLTSIMSVLENCKNDNIHIHVLCSNISPKNIKVLENLSLSLEKCKIFVKMVENPYLNLGEKHRHVSKTALLKFSLPEIFSDLDKILYLDSDILVYKDLEELYNIDLEDYYAAVVSDIKAVKCYNFDKKLCLKNYFNSGVMLLNLKKMRANNITQTFIELKTNETEQSFMDQNAINAGFNNNVMYIEPKYNLQYSGFKTYNHQEIAEYYGLNLFYIENMYKNPTILHLTGDLKPWDNFFCDNFKEWFLFFQKIPNKNLKMKEIFYILIQSFKFIIKFIIKKINRFIEKIFEYIIPIKINKKKIEKQIHKNQNLCLNKKHRKTNIIISLTSFPERIDELKFCLFSLFNQSIKPDKIVLYLSDEEFHHKETDLPIEVLNFKKFGLEIKWIKNRYSYNKLIYALKDFPNDIIVTVDDDIYYNKNFLKTLYCSYNKAPNCIHAQRVHKIVKNKKNNILSYEHWIKEIDSNKVDYTNFLTGVGGVLYPPKIFNEEVFNEPVFTKICPYADDIWFWAMSVLNQKIVKVVEQPVHYKYINLNREKGLDNEKTLTKKNIRESYNDKQFINLLDKYPLVRKRLNESVQTKEDAEISLKAELPKFYFRICSRIVIKLFNKIYKMKRY